MKASTYKAKASAIRAAKKAGFTSTDINVKETITLEGSVWTWEPKVAGYQSPDQVEILEAIESEFGSKAKEAPKAKAKKSVKKPVAAKEVKVEPVPSNKALVVVSQVVVPSYHNVMAAINSNVPAFSVVNLKKPVHIVVAEAKFRRPDSIPAGSWSWIMKAVKAIDVITSVEVETVSKGHHKLMLNGIEAWWFKKLEAAELAKSFFLGL